MNKLSTPLTIPDLRFESSFLRSLDRYAGKPEPDKLTDSELQLLGDTSRPKPVGAVTPGIVTYAIIKDIVCRPLVEGFIWAMIVLLAKPTLRLITMQGQRVGIWAAGLLGSPVRVN